MGEREGHRGVEGREGGGVVDCQQGHGRTGQDGEPAPTRAGPHETLFIEAKSSSAQHLHIQSRRWHQFSIIIVHINAEEQRGPFGVGGLLRVEARQFPLCFKYAS